MTPEYAAGFFDGEGCVLISSGHHQLRVVINNSCNEVLQEFSNRWGNKVCQAHGTYVDNPKYKPRYSWVIRGERAREFLETIYPYLIVKREEARVAIEFQLSRAESSKENREWTKQLLQKLKRTPLPSGR